MLSIKLDETYSIKGNEKQFILIKKVRDRFVNDGYFTTLEGLLKDYLSVKIRVSSVKSVKELLAYQQMLITALNKVLQPLHIELHTLQNQTQTKQLQGSLEMDVIEPSKTTNQAQEVENAKET